jgi:hypothetical protein
MMSGPFPFTAAGKIIAEDLRRWSLTQARFLTSAGASLLKMEGSPAMRSADAPKPAARLTCLLGIDCGEELLHGARRRCTERLVEADRLRKLLADEVIAPREFAVDCKRLLDAIRVAAAQRPRRMPRCIRIRARTAPGTKGCVSRLFSNWACAPTL